MPRGKQLISVRIRAEENGATQAMERLPSQMAVTEAVYPPGAQPGRVGADPQDVERCEPAFFDPGSAACFSLQDGTSPDAATSRSFRGSGSTVLPVAQGLCR